MNKKALITGASSGIGKETAFVYAKNDYDLILVARRVKNLTAIKNDIEKKYTVKVQVVPLDLAILNAAETLFDQVKDENIDVLINNAGFGLFGDFLDEDLKKQEQMLLLNIITLTKLTKLFAKKMVKNGGGNIINIASTAAYQPVPGLATYAATKAYVLSFSEAIAFELKSKNVFVTAISPGATQSEFGQVAGFPESDKFFKGIPNASDLATFIYNAMQKKKTSTIHGIKNRLTTFSSRFAPRKMVTYIAYKTIN
ncbi:MAG TPA: SDR family oxidoreductase [Flavobacteriia bacterium]|nr:SDR family oxidoreductase [Flavobacteriia bacterium]